MKVEKIKAWYKGLSIKQRDYLWAIIITISLPIVISRFIDLTIGNFLLLVSVIFFTSLTILSAYLVTEALFYTGAEVSLTLFLAQIYCSIEDRQFESDQAFTFLILFAFIFILFKFTKRIIKATTKLNSRITKEEKKNHPILYWLSVFIFLCVMAALLCYIYLMFHPIITGICFIR